MSVVWILDRSAMRCYAAVVYFQLLRDGSCEVGLVGLFGLQVVVALGLPNRVFLTGSGNI